MQLQYVRACARSRKSDARHSWVDGRRIASRVTSRPVPRRRSERRQKKPSMYVGDRSDQAGRRGARSARADGAWNEASYVRRLGEEWHGSPASRHFVSSSCHVAVRRMHVHLPAQGWVGACMAGRDGAARSATASHHARTYRLEI